MTFQLILLQSVTPLETGQSLTLRDGRKFMVSKDSAAYSSIVPAITLALKRNKPIGLALDNKGAVVEAIPAQQATVTGLASDPQQPGVEIVSFENMAGRYRLLGTDPATPKIKECLKKSLAEKKAVWFVNDVKSGRLVAAGE